MGSNYERRGQDFADSLHARSRESSFEYRKLLTSLSTGTLALFFLALTTEIKPALTDYQIYTVAAAVICMGNAVFFGLFCWHADATRNYYWARVEEGKQKSGGPEFDTLAKAWKVRLQRATIVLEVSFCVGIACSLTYMVERLLAW